MTTDFSIATLSKDCMEQLALNQNPFTEHAGDTYIYSDKQTEMTTNIILENLEKSNSSIVITGDQGVGKTTYLRKLLRKGYQRYQFCTLRAKTNMSFQDICNKISQRWIQHTPSEKHNPLSAENIEEYVVTYLGENNYGVIIVDDADRLGIEVINELLTLKHRVSLALPGQLGLVMTGKNSISLSLSELEGINPAASQIYQINVRPFTKDQTVNYVKFRLHTAGTGDQSILTDDEIEGIHDASRGVMRDIHRLAISALRNKCAQLGTDVFAETTVIPRRESRSLLKPALLVGLPVLAAVAVFWVQLHSPKEKAEQVPLTLPEQLTVDEQVSSPIDDQLQVEPSVKAAVIEPLPKTTDALPENLEEQIASISDDVETVDTPSAEDTVATLQAKEPEQEAKPQPLPDNNQPQESKSSEAAVEDQPGATKIAASEDVSSQDKAPLFGIDWLKQLDDGHFSLQLLASAEEKPLQELVKKHNFSEQYAIYVKSVNNKKWYVLIFGDYPSRQAAAQAIKSLPADLQKNKPWPVSLQSIKAQL